LFFGDWPFAYLYVIAVDVHLLIFKDRSSAERAAEAWANGLDIEGERAGVKWGGAEMQSRVAQRL